MIEVIRNEKGDIQCVAEWWLVNSDGSFNEKGLYVWLAQVEISGSHKNNGVMGFARQIYKGIIQKAPLAKFGYLQRLNKKNNKIRMYSRSRWMKHLGRQK